MKSSIVSQLLFATLLAFRTNLAVAQTNPRKSIPDYSKQIKGIFILNGAECAGFEFMGKELVWRNESACMYPDTFLIYWTDSRSFIAKEKSSSNSKPSRPPLIWFYTVSVFDGKKLVVDEIATGWGSFKTERQTFRKATE